MAKHVVVDLFVWIVYPFQPDGLYQPHYPEMGHSSPPTYY